MKKLIMLFTVAVATLFMVCPVISQEFIYYTPKEYLQGEANLVEIIKDNFFENPEFVAIIYNNNYSRIIKNDLLGDDFPFNSDLDLENMNANNWIYIFKDRDNPSNYFAAAIQSYLIIYPPDVIEFNNYIFSADLLVFLPANFNFSLDNEIPLPNDAGEWDIMDSPDFLSMLIEGSSFTDLIANTNNLKNFTISLQSYDVPTYEMEANKLYWVSIVESGDSICVCYVRAEKGVNDFLHCNTYANVQEKTITHFTVSPNPTVGDFTVSFDLEKSCNLQILLCDILGKELFQFYDGFASAGNFNRTFNTENLSKGIYFLKILADGNSTVEKIIVE